MAEKLEPTNNNLASRFNGIVNEISQSNLANKTGIEALIADATSHLALLNNQIVVATNTATNLRAILSSQSLAFNRNVTTRGMLDGIEQQIPLRLQTYPALSTTATNLQTESSQFVIGTSVLAASQVLSDLVTLGKQIGKVVAVDGGGNFAFVTSPTGTDRMSTACFQNQQPAGTGGGRSTPFVWTERLSNVTMKAEGGIVLTNGRIALPPGKYILWGFVACSQCGRFKSQLVNRNTGGSFEGSNVASSLTGDDFNGFSYVDAAISLSVTNSFSLETMVEAEHLNPLFTNGSPVNLAATPEVYASIVILKLS